MRADGYGGLSDYPVPAGPGGRPEFAYCAHYAKRAFRLLNLVEARELTLPAVKREATVQLGRAAARQEIADYDAYAQRRFPTPSALAAERFVRCASTLKLPLHARNRHEAESCFNAVQLLDLAVVYRIAGAPPERVRTKIATIAPDAPSATVGASVDLAFAAPLRDEDTPIVEDTWANCFDDGARR